MRSYQYGDADVENVATFSNTNGSKENKQFVTNDQQNKKQPKIFLMALLLVLLCVIFYVSKTDTPFLTQNSDSPSLSISEKFGAPLNEYSIYATNEYGHFSAPYSFFDDYPGAQLVEPYKKTTITISGSHSKLAEFNFVWKFHGDPQEFTGPSIEITRTSTGVYDLEIQISNAKSGEYVATYKTSIIVKYVKRDMMSLTIDDRERFLNAAHKIWEHSSVEGRAIYGPKFTGIHTFVKEHAVASGDMMCDQFHEGSGFLTHHLAMSNSFEASMRTVDPSVTLPYWDFSVEGQAIQDAGQAPSYLRKISTIFSDTWFGDVDEDSHISSSRWAHSSMPKVEYYDFDRNTSQNSYGLIRSYWNNNPDEKVVRHLFDICGTEDTNKIIPDCKTHFSLINSTTIAHFQLLSPTEGHGPMHVQFGGMFGGCTEGYKTFVAKWGDYMAQDITNKEMEEMGLEVASFKNKWGEKAQRRLMFDKLFLGEWFHIYRGLWRSHMCAADGASGLLECPKKCVSSTPFEDCKCSVKKLATGETTWQNLLPCFLATKENQAFFNKTMTEEFMLDAITMVATSSVKEGEMLHSASPADILFWMVHPVIERLLAAKRLNGLTTMGDAQFVKWSDEMSNNKDSWLQYSYYDLKEGANAFHKGEYTCKGHAADDHVLPDMLPLSDHMMGAADINKDGKITNWEFYMALDPNNVHTSDYVFDNFEWNHCMGVEAAMHEKDVPSEDYKTEPEEERVDPEDLKPKVDIEDLKLPETKPEPELKEPLNTFSSVSKEVLKSTESEMVPTVTVEAPKDPNSVFIREIDRQ